MLPSLLVILVVVKSLAGALLLSAFVLLFCRCSGAGSPPWQRRACINRPPRAKSSAIPLWIPESIEHYELKGKECQK